MRLQSNVKAVNVTKLALLSVLLASAIIIGILERAIPFESVVPGVKLGLANVVILICLYLFKFKEVFLFTVLKCVLTALATGGISSLLYSVSGSMLSLIGMYILLKISGRKLSAVGISVCGAVFHNTGQVLMASFITNTLLLFTYLPVLMVSAVVTGVLTGLTVKCVLPYMGKHVEIR